MGNPAAVSRPFFAFLFGSVLHTLLRLVAVEVSVGDDSGSFAHGDRSHADDGLWMVSYGIFEIHM